MKAIFNKNCIMVGWYERQAKNIFSRELVWVGFENDSYFFSRDGRWLGGLISNTFVDKKGRPVAWLEDYYPVGCNMLTPPIQPLIPIHPITPLRPLMPLTPLRPLVPLGGWSPLEWNEYIKQ